MRRAPADIKKILVVRNDRFGEFLLNIPALRALKETFASARIIAVVDPRVKGLAGRVPFIDETIGWAGGEHSFSQWRGLLGVLRKNSPDLAIILNPSKEFNLLAFLAGIPRRIGYDRKWGSCLTKR